MYFCALAYLCSTISKTDKKVTSNLRGVTFVDFFFVKKIKVRHLRYNFSKNSKENIKMRTSY